MRAKFFFSTTLVLACGSIAAVASGQDVAVVPQPQQNQPAATATDVSAPAPYPNATQGMSPEQLKIWNSPTMLRARAWVQEYCQRSAKITPQEANEYMAEMERMTPTQMKLWLLKFQEEEENVRQQQAAFDAYRQASVGRATSVEQATRQAGVDINRGETQAAETAQQSLNSERDAAQERLLQKSSDRNTAATMMSTRPIFMGGYPYGYGGWGYGAYPSGGEFHYHVHYHGNQ
jgi:hypothetical protein